MRVLCGGAVGLVVCGFETGFGGVGVEGWKVGFGGVETWALRTVWVSARVYC